MKKREDAIMKHRLTACLLAGAMALALGTGAALANGGVENGGIAAVAARGRNAAFVDEDGDGVCDNCGRGAGFVDEDGDGVCDNCGRGAGFVDEDGDGVCDNARGGRGRGRRRTN